MSGLHSSEFEPRTIINKFQKINKYINFPHSLLGENVMADTDVCPCGVQK